MRLISELSDYVQGIQSGFGVIPEDRKPLLGGLVAYLKDKNPARLNFICTHNSRRSQMSQIWAQVAAHYYGIEVIAFSGGTEATAFHPNAVAAMRRARLSISKGEGDNPPHKVLYSNDVQPLTCFSKKFDDAPNPVEHFAAIMTCSEADADCPFVFGADARIKLLYQDPKMADGTKEEESTYNERCRQVAKEMFYVFSQVKR